LPTPRVWAASGGLPHGRAVDDRRKLRAAWTGRAEGWLSCRRLPAGRLRATATDIGSGLLSVPARRACLNAGEREARLVVRLAGDDIPNEKPARNSHVT
jgi:hypothetical protein